VDDKVHIAGLELHFAYLLGSLLRIELDEHRALPQIK
jgi:hypothetical protein